MFFLYNILILLASKTLDLVALFSPKIGLFVNGRKTVFQTLTKKISPNDKTVWFHAASLGEYEQGLPVIEKIKGTFPNHKIVLTFFSPSGFEVRKNNTIAHVTTYLPLDSKKNATKFIQLVHPEMVFFIKYEFWPNYLFELKKAQIATYLISGILRKNQLFFKWYGGFYRKSLASFTYFFVQNEVSKELLSHIGLTNVLVSGDTRFDRVATILERDNSLRFVEEFKNNQNLVVVGSSWPKDETLIANYINNTKLPTKFIIAPHNIIPEQIALLKNKINRKTALFSEMEKENLTDYNVLIMDTIGILTKIYSYATIAYIGGGFGNPGVHNVLEPATFGLPIVIGPNFQHFAEAVDLANKGGCISISNEKELQSVFDDLLVDDSTRTEKGQICSDFVSLHKGATFKIMDNIKTK